jgi:heme a synthase
VDTPPLGPSGWHHLPAADRVLHRPAQSDAVSGMEAHGHLRHDWVPGLHRLVDGQERPPRRPLCPGRTSARQPVLLADPAKAAATLAKLQHPALRFFKGSVTALALLVFTTAMSGALVAGLDAGLIYNEFPYMGLGLTPPKKELFDPFYSHVPDQSDLWWRNMLENPSLVQLDHRVLATTTFTAVMSLFAYTRFSASIRSVLPRDAKKGMMGMVHLVWMQAALGISTLIYMVPTWLAASHQAGALALLTGATILYSRVSMPRRAIVRQIFAHSPVQSPKTAPLRSRLQAAEAVKTK